MKRKAISGMLVLAICLVNGCSIRSHDYSYSIFDLDETELFKRGLTDWGTGENSRWKVELKDGRKIQGYTSEIREDGGTFVDWETDEFYDVNFDKLSWIEIENSDAPSLWVEIFALAVSVVGGAAAGSIPSSGLRARPDNR